MGPRFPCIPREVRISHTDPCLSYTASPPPSSRRVFPFSPSIQLPAFRLSLGWLRQNTEVGLACTNKHPYRGVDGGRWPICGNKCKCRIGHVRGLAALIYRKQRLSRTYKYSAWMGSILFIVFLEEFTLNEYIFSVDLSSLWNPWSWGIRPLGCLSPAGNM